MKNYFEDEDEHWQSAYFSACNAAAGLLVDAELQCDEAALTEAVRKAAYVWASWKLEPPGLPTLKPGERHRVLRDRGVTLIDLSSSGRLSGRKQPEAEDEEEARMQSPPSGGPAGDGEAVGRPISLPLPDLSTREGGNETAHNAAVAHQGKIPMGARLRQRLKECPG